MAKVIKRHTTYMWQEQKGQPYYRIQTNDHRVAKKLKNRARGHTWKDGEKVTTGNPQGVIQVSFSPNSPLWIFQLRYSSPKTAQRGLSRITNAQVKKMPVGDIFVAYTLPDDIIQAEVDHQVAELNAKREVKEVEDGK